MAKFGIVAVAAATLVLTTAGPSMAGNYSTGVQIGNAPTAAQRAFHQDQLRIRYEGGSLHESERRDGSILVKRLTKHVWYSMRDLMRGNAEEWQTEYVEEPVAYE